MYDMYLYSYRDNFFFFFFFFFGKREKEAWVTKRRKKVFIKFGDELLFKRFVLHFSKI